MNKILCYYCFVFVWFVFVFARDGRRVVSGLSVRGRFGFVLYFVCDV